jgi:hypothetical protein
MWCLGLGRGCSSNINHICHRLWWRCSVLLGLSTVGNPRMFRGVSMMDVLCIFGKTFGWFIVGHSGYQLILLATVADRIPVSISLISLLCWTWLMTALLNKICEL